MMIIWRVRQLIVGLNDMSKIWFLIWQSHEVKKYEISRQKLFGAKILKIFSFQPSFTILLDTKYIDNGASRSRLLDSTMNNDFLLRIFLHCHSWQKTLFSSALKTHLSSYVYVQEFAFIKGETFVLKQVLNFQHTEIFAPQII